MGSRDIDWVTGIDWGGKYGEEAGDVVYFLNWGVRLKNKGLLYPLATMYIPPRLDRFFFSVGNLTCSLAPI